MKENITYSECLSDILQALDLKSSRLAREINIDSSLIYKWLRDERVPPRESPYIELILKCIEKRLNNPSQGKALRDVLDTYGIELSETNNACILSNLKVILQNSQGYSIRLHNKVKSRYKLFSTKITVAAFIENMDARNGAPDGYDSPCDAFHTAVKNDELFCSHDNALIIKGTSQVLYSALKLLEQSPEFPLPDSNTILITLNNDFRSLFETKDRGGSWIQTLHNLLSGGWNIIFKVQLDNNINRTIKIIEYVQTLLASGNLTIYYTKQSAGFSHDTELCIVPQTGALFSFSTNIENQIDGAFLFRSKQSIEMLTERFFYDLNSAKPLLRSYPPQISSEFQQALAASEEEPGDKYVFKGGLSTVTIPLHLYEKYLKLGNGTCHEISYRIFLHRKRIEAFETHVKYFKFKDICFIDSVNELVDKKRYSPDESYILKDNIPDDSDIISHLENLVDLLRKHDNYDIAFVSREDFSRMANISWMVKGKNSVLIESFRNSWTGESTPHSEMNFTITETSAVNAFHDYFLILWSRIPNENKNKKNSIAWLRSLIKKVETAE